LELARIAVVAQHIEAGSEQSLRASHSHQSGADYPDRPVLRVHTVSLEPDRAATPRISNYRLGGGFTLTRHPVAVDS
jgi:hypothetical protein